MSRRILFGLLHGLIGLIAAAFLFGHKCAKGDKEFERIAPLLVFGICFLAALPFQS